MEWISMETPPPNDNETWLWVTYQQPDLFGGEPEQRIAIAIRTPSGAWLNPDRTRVLSEPVIAWAPFDWSDPKSTLASLSGQLTRSRA